MESWPDEPIDEIREIRHQISARFDHDPDRLVAHYMAMQARDLATPSRTDDQDRIEEVIARTADTPPVEDDAS